MQSFTVAGVKQKDFEPQLVISKEVTQDVNLLNVIFETNPLGTYKSPVSWIRIVFESC